MPLKRTVNIEEISDCSMGLYSGHAPANLACEGKEMEKLKVHARMQYRHEIGHALANFAFVAVLTSSFALARFQ